MCDFHENSMPDDFLSFQLRRFTLKHTWNYPSFLPILWNLHFNRTEYGFCLSFTWKWNNWVFHIVHSISIFLGTWNVYRVLQTFWTYFSVCFGLMQIRSKSWPLGMILFHNILYTLKMTGKITRMKLKYSEYCACALLCRNSFLFHLVFFIPLP